MVKFTQKKDNKNNQESENNVWLGLAGLAIGAIGAAIGYGISQFQKKDKEKENIQQYQQQFRQDVNATQYPEQQKKQPNKLQEEEQKVPTFQNQPTKFQNETQNFQDNENIICPISQEIMTDPYSTKCGHSFQKENIKNWLQKQPTCPICKARQTTDDIFPNFSLKNTIQDILKKK